MQLERILQRNGFGTRRACRVLIAQGRVAIGGVVRADPAAEIATEGLVFSVDGVDWPHAEFATVVLNKPAGYECSRQPQHHRSVLELLPLPLRERGVQPVGRLDADTTGLLLLTDDGDLLHRVISPKRHVAKVYRATLARPLVGSEGDVFAAGGLVLEGEDKPLSPAVLEVLSPTEARLTVTEGRYHMVRRMFAAVGNHVEGLHRERVGGLALPDDLAPGAWCLLDQAQIDLIFA